MPEKPMPASKKVGAKVTEKEVTLKEEKDVTTPEKRQNGTPKSPVLDLGERKPQANICHELNCPMNKPSMGCGYEADMRLKAAHSKTSKKKLFTDSSEDVKM